MSTVFTTDTGTISFENYKGSVGYSIYVPENVNPNTPIFTYTYGGGKKDDWYSGYHVHGNYGIYDALKERGSNSIVIMPDMDWGADWGKNTMGIINQVRNQYNITNLSVSGSGFSKGGFGGFDIVAENIKQNPNIDPQVVFFIDDYSSTYYMTEHKLTPEKAQLFKENNTTFFVYDPYWKQTENYQPFLDAGINMIRVEPKDFDHIQINANFFKNGIYDYMAGKKLPESGYVYKMYNRETGTWDVIDYEQICTKNKLYDFCSMDILKNKISFLNSLKFYDIKSDEGILSNYLNDILGQIKSSTFLNADLGNFSGSSTTCVPSEVPTSVRNYYSNISNVLSKIATLLDSIADIHGAYEKTDQNMTQYMHGLGLGLLERINTQSHEQTSEQEITQTSQQTTSIE